MALLPKVKLKAIVSFPATILDGVGIDVVKENGSYQFDIAYDDFAPPVAGISNPTHQNALLWNDITKQYVLAPISLIGSGGAVPEAPNDGVQYGRQSLTWTPVVSGGGGGTPSNSNPIMDGVAAPGVAAAYSRGDHVHPTDTSRAAVTYVDTQDALKAPLASPALTGNPTAPTPTPGDNDTSIATTAFVTAAVTAGGGGAVPATVPPLMDGTAAVGVSAKYTREDHVHPTDTSRAPLASPVFTGNPTAPTPTPGDNDTSIATTAFVTAAVVGGGGAPPSNTNPIVNGVAAPGIATAYSRGDHVHPIDTSRVAKAGDTMIGNLTMSGTAVITAPQKPNQLGNATGAGATTAVAQADANILLYNAGATNWAGIGTDTGGSMWFKTGTSGTPVPAMWISSTSYTVNFTVSPLAPTPTAGDNSTKLATTAFVAAAGLVKTVRTQFFTASGTYTPSAGMLYCVIECWAGGGAGGGVTGSAANSIAAAGGGSGSYSRSLVAAASVGASQVVTIGAAGVAGAAGSNPGGGGGNTSVGTLCIANGGQGGQPSYYGAQGVGGLGGAQGTGLPAGAGMPGGPGFNTSSVANFVQSGVGGSTSIGGGGSPQITGGGLNGTGYGAGGSGGSVYNATTIVSGGYGTIGFALITEYCSQ